jgi:hypothetical protein
VTALTMITRTFATRTPAHRHLRITCITMKSGLPLIGETANAQLAAWSDAPVDLVTGFGWAPSLVTGLRTERSPIAAVSWVHSRERPHRVKVNSKRHVCGDFRRADVS